MDSLPALETLETGEGGNTTTPSPSKPPQPLQHLHHTFTWNNYEENDIETIINLFKFISYDYVFQEEKGELCGTPHLQGVVSLKKRARWSEFGLPRCIHWEKVAHVSKCYAYCSDPNKRYGRCWSLKWIIPKKLKLIHSSDFYEWQRNIMNYLKEEPDDRTINWVWSRGGSVGKSSFCKYLAHHHNAIICGRGAYSDILNIIFNSNMDQSNIVVFDLPRNNGNKISYSALESIKNGLVVNTKYETGYKLFNPPHIIVFSNDEPEYEAMSSDRFRVINCDKILYEGLVLS